MNTVPKPGARPADLPDVLLRIVARRRAKLGSSSPWSVREPAGAFGADRPELLVDSDFLGALRSTPGTAVIAEVKMGSPKLGDIRSCFDPERQAEKYAKAGAAALSVVVEPEFFFGSYELLARCRRASGLPAIAKDFVVHPSQLEMAREAGADAILLIAALYEADELAGWARAAREVGLVPLVETHGATDAAKLLGRPWELVGVNNRNLRSFSVDLAHSIEMVKLLPAAALLVAESGIAERSDVERLAGAGFGAFLVGESLLLAKDPEAKLAELLGKIGFAGETER